ncbi:hypothetical protein ATANTOWER_014729 [Ataeniobius toweri]|uniref:Uncharacterized protein n=1 Tax=Ataeniobius toweri TaxID=208326 RepID=A0ABU7BBT8_9TELE|nr:hypothetical protein [Ataeniobius toweri]
MSGFDTLCPGLVLVIHAPGFLSTMYHFKTAWVNLRWRSSKGSPGNLNLNETQRQRLGFLSSASLTKALQTFDCLLNLEDKL